LALIGFFAEGMATPIICFLRSRGYAGLRWFLLGGLSIGIWLWLFLMFYYLPYMLQAPRSFLVLLGLLGCIPPALISTTLFWFLAGRQTTNRWTGAE